MELKKIITIIIIVFFLSILGGVWLYNSKIKDNNTDNVDNINKSDNYQAERSSTKIDNNEKKQEEIKIETEEEENIQKTEVEMAQFTTKIYNKDKARQNNMRITCDTLTNKEVKPGEVFSFCNTVGKATTAKGYQEADIYVDGKKTQGLGGGNCQISTTLYNTVIQIPELEVIERHTHSGKVPYIKDGKDAAVAYGSYDFKFKNNSSNTIKIVISNDTQSVTAKILKK